MELPKLGQHCAQIDCKQLDFLPLLCKCGKQFCSDHFNLHTQQCETNASQPTELKKIDNVFKCSFENCNEVSLVSMFCEKCQKHFCVKHRHVTQCYEKDEKTIAEEKEKIAAPIRQFNEAKILVDKHVEQSLLEAKKKGKNTNLANKVQLMKIKNKARGLSTIPTTDRLYFNIVHSENAQSNPVFVSKNWSIGRAIDAIANECKLRNDNNKSTGKKLRLFKQDNNEVVSTNLAEILQDLITKNVIVDGENLKIDYVNPDDCHIVKS